MLCTGLGFVLPALALEPVTLQLKWWHSFQFAGYYAAQAKGFYRDAGFDVTIREALPGERVVEEVVSGRAGFGVGTSSLLLERHAGAPVVVLAVVFQHSPYVIIARPESGIDSVHDLVGKRVMMEPLSEELLAYLGREGIGPERIQRLEHSFDLADFAEGRVDAISAYLINQPFYLEQLKSRYLIFSPRAGGVDFYGDNLFTSERMLKAQPGRVAAFREASLRGWEYAMAHPEEVAALIRSSYSQANGLDYLLFQAARMRELVQRDVVPVGYMHEGRWRHIAETYAELGMLPRRIALTGFLYDPAPRTLPDWAYPAVAVSAAILLLVGLVAWHILRINDRLRRSLADVRAAHGRLQVLSTAIEQSPAAVLIAQADGRIDYVNPRFSEITGRSASDVTGRAEPGTDEGFGLLPSHPAAPVLLANAATWSGELLARRADASSYWVETHLASVRNAEGRVERFIAISLDITARKQAEARLARSEADFRAVVENANDIIYRQNLDGTFSYLSPNLLEMLGHAPASLLDTDATTLVHPDDLEVCRAFTRSIIESRRKRSGLEFRMRHAEGDWRWFISNEAPLFDESGAVTAVLGIARDITERRRTEERIAHLAYHDALTGLPNRTLLFDRLGQAIVRARRSAERLGLLFIDLDRFKPINDVLGHAAGDAVLRECAGRIQAAIRASDAAARVGGDEFVVMLTGVADGAAVTQVAEKIRALLGQPVLYEGQALQVSASVGAALFPDHAVDADALVRNADVAMYHAKASGRDAVWMYRVEIV